MILCFTDYEYIDEARKYFGNPVCQHYSVFLPMVDLDEDSEEESEPNVLQKWDKAVAKLWSMRSISHAKNQTDSSDAESKNFTNTTARWSFLGRLFWSHNKSTTTSPNDDVTDIVANTTERTSTEVTTIGCQKVNTTASSRPAPCQIKQNDYSSRIVVREDEIIAINTSTGVRSKIVIPNLTLPVAEFDYIDSVVLLFFTVDLLLRLISCPSRMHYFLSFVNIFDACALITSYLYFVVVSVHRQYRYMETAWVSLLSYVQIFRVFRLFRVVQNVRAAKVLVYSITQNLQDMTLLVMLLFVGISFFACLLYFAEARSTIPSIPTAWYWAVVTMTTVGYGEVTPQTGLGQVIASFCAIAGVLLLSITMPLFVNKFVGLYRYSCINENMDRLKARRRKLENNNKTLMSM